MTIFCDLDGKAFIMQAIPADLIVALALDQSSTFAVPELNDLGTSDLTVQNVTQASQHIQDTSGLQSAGPSGTDLAERITSMNLSDVQLSDAIFFNPRVCDTDAAQISDNQMQECQARFGDNVNACIFNTKLLCGCRFLKIGSASWPYATDQAPSIQCVIE